jgi:hypothetical protein
VFGLDLIQMLRLLGVFLFADGALFPQGGPTYRLFGCREEQGSASEGVEVGDLPGWKRQSDQASIYFDTTVAARRAGKDALKELLNKLFN